MANAKGNLYPMWYVDNNQQVWAIGKGGVGDKHQMSNTGFAFEIGISEDGTVCYNPLSFRHRTRTAPQCRRFRPDV